MSLVGSNPPPLGPGCSDEQTSSQQSLTAVLVLPFGAAGANASSNNQKRLVKCSPNYESNQVNDTSYTRSSEINGDTLIMSKNTLKAISESTNQMIVNSISSVESKASQNAEIEQTINITIRDVAGNVDASSIGNEANIDLQNLATMAQNMPKVNSYFS